MATQMIHAGRASSEWAIKYTQTDVEMIREQIIQGEALKRRWLILGLILTTAGLATVLVLLSTSYALYARASSAKESLAKENSALATRASEAQKALDARIARDAEQQRAEAETQETLKGLLATVMGNSDVPPSVGGRFAKVVHHLGGRVETASKPSDKLFRNWRVNTGSEIETYAIVGGFDEGKWVIYSNLIARKRVGTAPGSQQVASR
ncbi:MAG TPA: hypothetical protein VID27_22280 [Blastocatellia bacterium]|jgi:hypothetical protein